LAKYWLVASRSLEAATAAMERETDRHTDRQILT
jgi:hypothetical protein